MKTNIKLLIGISCAIAATLLASCHPFEDPGSLREEQRSYSVADFDQLEMGDAFKINVEQGEAHNVVVKGDARNLDDLLVYVESGTLKVRFDDYRNRRHQTYITIAMPQVKGLNFSGASTATVSGLVSDNRLDVVVSGASKLTLNGYGEFLNSSISGASRLYAFDYLAQEVYTDVSGASKARVYAEVRLDAIASGASYIGYKGEPVVYKNTSGASIVRKE